MGAKKVKAVKVYCGEFTFSINVNKNGVIQGSYRYKGYESVSKAVKNGES